MLTPHNMTLYIQSWEYTSFVTDSLWPSVTTGNWTGKGNIGVGWGRNEKFGGVRDGREYCVIVLPY
jgi:hypothetical protein